MRPPVTAESRDSLIPGSSSSSSTSDTATRRSQLAKRADGDFDYANFYLTTGLATLVAFWLSLYTFLLTLGRLLLKPPRPRDEDGGGTGFWDGIKRFSYRVVRPFLLVNCILIVAVLFDVVVKSSSYKSATQAEGLVIGTGVGRECPLPSSSLPLHQSGRGRKWH